MRGLVPDVLLLGVARSGTSMMCGLMHNPPDWVMLYEPSRKPVRQRPGPRWGMKLVSPDHIEFWMATGPPMLVIMQRDLRECVRSMWEKIKYPKFINSSRTMEERMGDMRRTSSIILGIEDRDGVIRIDYERFVTSEEYRREIRSLMGWTIGGDPSWKCQLPIEKDRHKNQITSNSIGLDRSEAEEHVASFMAHDECRRLQERYGYSCEV